MNSQKFPIKQQLIMALIASIISLLLVTSFGWFLVSKEMNHREELVQSRFDLVHNKLHKNFEKIDNFLVESRDMDSNCKTDDLLHLQNKLFELSPVVEISLIDSSGYVRCSSWGNDWLALKFSPPLTTQGLRYKGPSQETINGAMAFGLARSTAGGGEIAAQVPISWMQEMLDDTVDEKYGFLALVDNYSGVPVIINGDYTLPLDQNMYPITERLDFFANFDDMQTKYFVGMPLTAIPSLALVGGVDKTVLYNNVFFSHFWLLILLILFTAVIFVVQKNLVVNQQSLRKQIQLGIKNNEFFNAYQPLVDARNGKPIGIEVLARWQHPTEGLVSPAHFIGEAEATGLDIDLSINQIERAAVELSQIIARNKNFKVSINITGNHLSSESFLNCIDIYKDSIPGLFLELTERDILDEKLARLVLNKIKKMGIGIAIDDFGTGYSGLQYLQSFPIDTLKIDRSFVSSISNNTENAPVLDVIINLSKQLNIAVIAEGVETSVQAEYLMAAGINIHQGWLYSKAEAIHGLTKYMNTIKQEQRGVSPMTRQST